jgi:uncharacterized protein YbcC (UPF0753/DUF2309 family)
VVPVAGGISLEYYFSRVDNVRYGCGTKVPHNVTGLIGVMDGAQSDLRTGLPYQMVWVHEPMRLIFVVEAVPALANAIVQCHRAMQKLFDHRWLHLVTLDYRSGAFHRYQPGGPFEHVPIGAPASGRPGDEKCLTHGLTQARELVARPVSDFILHRSLTFLAQ